MPVTVSSVEGRARPRTLESGVPGKMFTYVRSDFLMPSGAGGPQAFLVEMDQPGAAIPPHFHRVDEFQMVVRGGGTMGKHPIGVVCVHFAEAYTPYGPIVVGGDGLAFFTLRPAPDSGALYMPGARAQMIRKARRNIAGSAGLDTASERAARAGATTTRLLDGYDDGLSAVLLRLGAGQRGTGPDPADGGGQYYLVVAGDVRVEGKALPQWSCAWVAAGERAPALEAGQEGAEVVIAQFPRRQT